MKMDWRGVATVSGRVGRGLAAWLCGFVVTGCGLNVDIMSTPNPAMVGVPVEMKVTVENTNGPCTVDNIEICIFPFSELTAEQQELLAVAEQAKAEAVAGSATGLSLPSMTFCDLDIASQAAAAVALPANGVVCTAPNGNEPVACTLGPLTPGQSTSFTITVTPSKTGSFVNLVDASGEVVGNGDCALQSAFDFDSEIIAVSSGVAAPVFSGNAMILVMTALFGLGVWRLRRRQDSTGPS